MAHFDRAGPYQQLEIACQASSSQPRLTAASLNPRQPSTSTQVNPSTSTVTLVEALKDTLCPNSSLSARMCFMQHNNPEIKVHNPST
jgi:hypothetical protein